tara:strand:+ start:160 stop:786 length:627 start_codon:yes stop_codon:yes gene_type:complete
MDLRIKKTMEVSTDLLLEQDSQLTQVFKAKGYLHLRPSNNLLISICRTIIHQQLSSKAAATIYDRFTEVINSTDSINAERLSTLSMETLRNVGISYRKAGYILSLAEKVKNNEVHLDKLKNLSDDDVITELTRLDGIGLWSAHMFLILNLGRPDIFPTTDAGIRKGYLKLTKRGMKFSESRMIKDAKKWKPFRTIASLYLWEIADTKE